MRILVLVARDPKHPRAAGGDRHLAYLAKQLAADSNEVTLWSSSAPALPPREDLDGVHVRRLAPPRLLGPVVWARLSFGPPRGTDLVIEEVIGGERTPFLARVWSRLPRVGFWYQDNRPLFRDQYGPILRRVAGGVQSLLLRGYRHGYLLTPSNGSRQWLLQQGFDGSHIVVSYLQADPLGLADDSRPFGARRNRIVAIGNFRPLKRFEEAIDVLSLLLPQLPDAELVLLGRQENSSYLESLRQRANALHVSDRVRFSVDADDEEKYRYLAEAKVLTVHSSIEGFALTLCEAGLCGVPAVANPGVPTDAFRPDVSGIRVPMGDVRAYADACLRLMRDESTWTSYSRGAFQVAEPYSHSTLTPEVTRLLEAARSQRRPPRTGGTAEVEAE